MGARSELVGSLPLRDAVAMALFPTESEAKDFTNAAVLFKWVGLREEEVQFIEKECGEFANVIRNVALLPMKEVVKAAENAKDASGGALPPVRRAQFGLAWRIARRLGAASWDSFEDVDPFEPSPAPSAAASGTAAGAAASTSSVMALQKKLRLNTVIDQSDDTEISVAEESLIASWFTNWQAFAQGPADAEEEPTWSNSQRCTLGSSFSRRRPGQISPSSRPSTGGS